MDIQQAIKTNKLLSDANIRYTGLVMKGIFDTDDIIFYIDTFRRNNKLIPYLTFRHNEKCQWKKIYVKIVLYFPENISNQIYLPNN